MKLKGEHLLCCLKLLDAVFNIYGMDVYANAMFKFMVDFR